jgi:hypothetical protein
VGKGYGINVMLLGKAWRTHRNLGNFEQVTHLTHTHTHNCSSSQALVASSKFGLLFKLEKVKLRNNPMKFGVIKLKFQNSTSSTFLKIRDQTDDITIVPIKIGRCTSDMIIISPLNLQRKIYQTS